MNLFIYDEDININAIYHPDKHIVKMPLEVAQLLCSALHVHPNIFGFLPPYKLTHKNHPCAIWTRNTLSNYLWVCEYGLALCREYTFRYNKRHKCETVILNCEDNLPNILGYQITDRPLCMPDQYKITGQPVESYRNYFNCAKQHIAKWTKRQTPYWFVPNNERI